MPKKISDLAQAIREAQEYEEKLKKKQREERNEARRKAREIQKKLEEAYNAETLQWAERLAKAVDPEVSTAEDVMNLIKSLAMKTEVDAMAKARELATAEPESVAPVSSETLGVNPYSE